MAGLTPRGDLPVTALAEREREDLADFLGTLTPEQWDAPSLCEGWRVRDVVAHVISYDRLGALGLVKRFAQGRLLLSRVNQLGVAEMQSASPDELLAQLRRHTKPRGLTSAFGDRVALVDGLVHHQDIRRPLGMPRQVPRERLEKALPFAVIAPPLRVGWHVRGVRLVAADLDWAAGRGPEARGPGETLLMTIAGRRGVAQELTGPGKEILVQRLG